MDGVKAGVAVFVFREDGKFLMLKRKGSHGEGTWALPGGSMEFGESFEEAARREVMEETNCLIEGVKFQAMTNDVFSETGKHFVTIWLTSRLNPLWGSGAVIVEPEKCSEMDWFDDENMPSPLFQPCWDNFYREVNKDKN